MKIINNSSEFELTFNSVSHFVPSGLMEIKDENLATFILAKARQWDLKVEKVGESKDVKIETIKQDIVAEPIEVEVSEEALERGEKLSEEKKEEFAKDAEVLENVKVKIVKEKKSKKKAKK